jgi:hypothetical protein
MQAPPLIYGQHEPSCACFSVTNSQQHSTNGISVTIDQPQAKASMSSKSVQQDNSELAPGCICEVSHRSHFRGDKPPMEVAVLFL